jgi:glucosyl-3-phosphoglycerate synthase
VRGDGEGMHPPYRWSDWSIPVLQAARAAQPTNPARSTHRGHFGQPTRISLVLPAYNEADTVGGIVARVRADLMDGPGLGDGPPLIDEIVVIDSDSDDDTAGRARSAGAKVHASSEILPGLDPVRGKGEAIWKSLFVTSGDLIVFLDADLTEWDTHFVTGVLGPLLVDPRVELVKGFYDRLARGSAHEGPVGEVSFEGGRVTELVARPLLARRWPELSGIVQPLAGEWAVRRSTLEALSMPVGYGVDLAALVDVYLRSGPRAIAQVDLGRRGHQHQSLRDLGLMALELIAVTDRRAGIPGPGASGGASAGASPEMPSTDTPATTLTTTPTTLSLVQFGPGADGAEPVTRSVSLLERPPAVTVPAYAERIR